MGYYLNTTGNATLAVAICARCSIKFPYDDLEPDPNYPGLRVCRDDLDRLDPYRLPTRLPEDITLEYPRPDTPLTFDDNTPAPQVYPWWMDSVLPTMDNNDHTYDMAFNEPEPT